MRLTCHQILMPHDRSFSSEARAGGFIDRGRACRDDDLYEERRSQSMIICVTRWHLLPEARFKTGTAIISPRSATERNHLHCIPLIRLMYASRKFATNAAESCGLSAMSRSWLDGHQVLVNVLLAFHVYPADQPFYINDGGGLADKLEHDEIALKSRVRAYLERHHRNVTLGYSATARIRSSCARHDRRAAQRPVQYRLVQHDLDLWRIFTGEHLLSRSALLNAFFDCRIIKPRNPCHMNRTCVISDLEQPGDNRRIEDRNRRRLLLQADEGRVRQREGMPPPLLLAFPRQRHEPFLLVRICNAVQSAKITDIARCRTALPRLHAAHLGWRAQELCGYLIHGHAALVAQRSQQGPEFAPANRGTARGTARLRHWRSLPSVSGTCMWGTVGPAPQSPVGGWCRWHMSMALDFGTCQLHEPEAPLNQTAEGILKRPADNGVER